MVWYRPSCALFNLSLKPGIASSFLCLLYSIKHKYLIKHKCQTASYPNHSSAWSVVMHMTITHCALKGAQPLQRCTHVHPLTHTGQRYLGAMDHPAEAMDVPGAHSCPTKCLKFNRKHTPTHMCRPAISWRSGLPCRGNGCIWSPFLSHKMLTIQSQTHPYTQVQASDILEQWITLQRQWMYLEPIFSSEDIMQQLPLEAKRFATVDRIWRKTLEGAKRNPLVLKVCVCVGACVCVVCVCVCECV